MFCPEIIALKEFYASPLGQATQNNIEICIKDFLDGCKDNCVLGIGFAIPYLNNLLDKNKTVFSLMPASQGVIHWGNNLGNLSLISDEAELPFFDNSIQRIIIIHALENSERVREMMSEISPNRRGIWARSPKSPFAFGQPFTHGQLKQLFAEHSFTPLRINSALFFPPGASKYTIKWSNLLEKVGRNILSGFGGVIIMEAEKQIYAPIARKLKHRKNIAYQTNTAYSYRNIQND